MEADDDDSDDAGGSALVLCRCVLLLLKVVVVLVGTRLGLFRRNLKQSTNRTGERDRKLPWLLPRFH